MEGKSLFDLLKLERVLVLLNLTWEEIHAFISGWGDAAAFDKAERLSPLPAETGSFEDILRREYWYYKGGRATGRLMWAGIIIAVAFALRSCS